MEFKELSLSEFEGKNRNIVFTAGKRHVLVIGVGSRIFALDNRCPHEGYPLSVGGVDQESCLLTCNWHNWKFDLTSGKCVIGADSVRTYPVEVESGTIKVDLRDPAPEEIEKKILEELKEAFFKQQGGRMVREMARLSFSGLDPLVALKVAIAKWSFDRFEYGTSHAYAASADWLALYNESEALEERLICLREAVEHIASDILRRPSYPFPAPAKSYSPEKLLAAIEAEDAKEAEALAAKALDDGASFADLKGVLAEAALAHYNDFGHSLIYVYKSAQLSADLNCPEVDRSLVLNMVRSIAYATREDLIPEFKHYRPSLEVIEKKGFGSGTSPLDAVCSLKLRDSLDWLAQNASRYQAKAIYQTLFYANAKNFLTFDLSYQAATDNSVDNNVGWLDFTHGITFANAVHRMCLEFPRLWPAGLAQMACFHGRNVDYTDPSIDVAEWVVKDKDGFIANVKEKLFDHGFARHIFSSHIIKTGMALFEEAAEAPGEGKEMAFSALNRFLQSPLKQRHVRRSVVQAIQLVQRDF